MANDKKILAVSKETHRGVSIYEIAPNGPVCFVLGMTLYEVANIDRARLFIDDWYALKKN